MRIHFGEYFVNFKDMYMYADFNLRINYASLERGEANRPKHIKPNLDLINFHEIRWINNNLKMWLTYKKQWVNCFPNATERQSALNDLYKEYIFETQVLQVPFHHEGNGVPGYHNMYKTYHK